MKEPSTLVYFSLFLHKHLVVYSCKHILHRTWPSRKQFICKSRESRHGSRWNANLHTNLLPPPSLSLWKLTMLSPESPPSLLPPHPSLRAPGIHGSTPSTQCRDFFLCPAPAVRVGSSAPRLFGEMPIRMASYTAAVAVEKLGRAHRSGSGRIM
jgi:hypothetical protein